MHWAVWSPLWIQTVGGPSSNLIHQIKGITASGLWVYPVIYSVSRLLKMTLEIIWNLKANTYSWVGSFNHRNILLPQNNAYIHISPWLSDIWALCFLLAERLSSLDFLEEECISKIFQFWFVFHFGFPESCRLLGFGLALLYGPFYMFSGFL